MIFQQRQNSSALLLVAAIALIGCAEPSAISKPAGSVESQQMCVDLGERRDCDICEFYGWYGDGECDDFCPRADRDCSGNAPLDGAVNDALTDMATADSGGNLFDVGLRDGSSRIDVNLADASPLDALPNDALRDAGRDGSVTDGGLTDSGIYSDAGVDSGYDGGFRDAGSFDSGLVDGGLRDAVLTDTTEIDGSLPPVDGGFGVDGGLGFDGGSLDAGDFDAGGDFPDVGVPDALILTP